MGLLNTIRKNPAILLVSIGLAMAGFIFMDMMTSGGPQGANQFTLGKVNGERIDWQVFSGVENRLFGNNGDIFNRRTQLWNYFVEKVIIDDMAEDLGIGVGEEELTDLEFGTNLSPIIQRNFSNPNTGQIDRQQLNQLRQAVEADQLPPELRSFWIEQEKEIIKDRKQAKISNLIAKAMYIPSWQAEVMHQLNNDQASVALVRIPFDVISDDEIALEDADFQAFLEESGNKYDRAKETRKVQYVSFPVVPSPADSVTLFNSLDEMTFPFAEAENDTLFVENNYGFIDGSFVTEDFFSSPEADTLFDLPAGSVYGPFIEGNQYLLVKVRDRMVIPDSVRARHILIQAQDPASIAQAQTTLDSLQGLIETGVARFDSLAAQYGQDATRSNGGDLGYAARGQMVKPFNDLIFFTAQEGKLYTVTTQFGVHLVEVTGRKFINNDTGIQIAMLQEPIIPSETTQKRAYQRALEVLSQNQSLEELESAVNSSSDLALQSSNYFEENDFNLGLLGQGSSAREIIRWAYQSADEGDVAPEIFAFDNETMGYTDRYVLVALDEVRAAGKATVASSRSEIEPLVKFRAKGQKIAESIGSTNDLQAIADRYGVSVDTLPTVSLANTFLTGVGNEPKLIGAISTHSVGTTTEPIVGNNGVYIARITSKPGTVPPMNIAAVRQGAKARTANLKFRFMDAAKKEAKIKDNRSTFY